MSKDVLNTAKSRLFPNNTEISTSSSSATEKTSTNSIQSVTCPFSSFSRIITNINDESDGSTSISDKSRDHHYISRVQPKYVSCSFKPIKLDESVMPEDNVEYSFKLGKEMYVQQICLSTKSDEKKSNFTDPTEEMFSFDVKALVDRQIENACKSNDEESSENISNDLIQKDKNKPASVKSLAGPRMTTSDSFLSINKKHFQDIGRKFILPSGTAIQACQKPSFTEKPAAISIQNKSNVESEETSSTSPISLFENEKYKTFTDSNSHDENIIDFTKSGISQNKSTTGKVEFKKGMELKNSSLLSIPSTVCRICHTNTANERLLSPCYCKGSLAYVHLSCLERWLNQSSRSYCELCLYQYNAVETLRYGFFEGIRMWIRHPRNRNHVRSDCLIAFLLTLVTLGLVVICFIGMDYFMIEGIKLGLSKMWTKSFIVSFLSIVMMAYFVTMYLIAKDQFVPWYTWWKNTLNIRLLLSPTVMQTQRV